MSKERRKSPTVGFQVTETRRLDFKHGKHEIDWSSDDPLKFDLTYDSGGEDGFTMLKANRGALIDLRDLIDRVLRDTDKARAAKVTK